MEESFLSQEDVDALLEGVTGPDEYIELKRAYERAWAERPYRWKPGSGYIDGIDGRFLALAFNMMHKLIPGSPIPGVRKKQKKFKSFHK